MSAMGVVAVFVGRMVGGGVERPGMRHEASFFFLRSRG